MQKEQHVGYPAEVLTHATPYPSKKQKEYDDDDQGNGKSGNRRKGREEKIEETEKCFFLCDTQRKICQNTHNKCTQKSCHKMSNRINWKKCELHGVVSDNEASGNISDCQNSRVHAHLQKISLFHLV